MIVFPFFSLLICIAIHFVQHKSVNNKKEQKFSELKPSPVFKIIGYITFFVFLMIGILLYLLESQHGVLVICSVFATLSTSLIFMYYGYSVVYDQKKLQYRKFFGKYKTIYYSQIVYIEYEMDLIIRTKSDTLTIPNYTKNVTVLYNYLNDKLSLEESKEKNVLPRIRKFKDSVYRPGEFYCAYTLMVAVPLSLSALLIWAYITDNFEQNISLTELLFMVGLFVISGVGFVIISIMSAKRAHSSLKWRKIAKLCFKEGYLKE